MGGYMAEGEPRGRVALLQGCVEPAMAPQIREAAIRLLSRAGFEVELVEGEGCCGALSEHLGRAGEAAAFAAANVRAWTRAGPFDAIVATAAGRSEERRVGKEGGSTCRSRWSQYH